MIIEIEFLVPIKEDRFAGNGELHPFDRWQWLEKEMYIRFKGWTRAPMAYNGVYEDEDTKEMVSDESRKYIVAIEKEKEGEVKKMLEEIAIEFRQKSIYMSVAGKVIFIKGVKKHGKQK